MQPGCFAETELGRRHIEIEGGLSIVIEGVWEIVGGKLITTWETLSASESYTIRDNRLMLVDNEDDAVSVWERN